MFTLLIPASVWLLGLAFVHSHPHNTEQTAIYPDYSTSSTIRDVLIDNEIIGDVLDDFEPTYYINLAYPKYHEAVLLGNDIPVKAVSDRPTFTFHSTTPDSDSNSTFTLILTDPDALSRDDPSKSEMCHWILTNLTTPVPPDGGQVSAKPLLSNLPASADSVEGELESYQPPSPPKKTGKHRYVFVLLEGDATHLKAPQDRPHWGYGKVRHGVRDWAEDNDLTVVGANFFFAQHKKQ